MESKIKVGVIGLGSRGSSMLKSVLLKNTEIEVAAVCDVYRDRVEETAKLVAETYGREPSKTLDYREVTKNAAIEAVFVFTDWSTHIGIAMDAMERGKAVAMEVGCAYSVRECWDLVRTYERTKSPFMMLENCCFDKDELMVTNMVRRGKLGTVVYCSGAYGHDLREEIADGYKNRHYRKDNYLHRNCENYPTHELGPIAKILDINRGNRMLSLVSFASKGVGMREYIKEKRPEEYSDGLVYRQGDVVTTLIKCANGETIRLKLDTTLPRRYDREFTVRGTKGNFQQTLEAVFLDGEDDWATPEKVINNREKYAEYLPPVWKNMTEEAKQSGHGGMDGITVGEFIRALKTGGEMPVDVYDAAAWMSISALSEESIATGCVVPVPDFTDGKWVTRKSKDVIELE